MNPEIANASMESDLIHPVKPLGMVFSHPEEDELLLSPEMRTLIDKRLKSAEEEVRNGQCYRLDDEFMVEFLEEAHQRNERIFGKNR